MGNLVVFFLGVVAENNENCGGGFKDVLIFLPLPGEMIQFD